MENARSLASRFSGLLLFLLSLAVVGVLVYLTIQSASDDSADSGEETAQVESETGQSSQSSLETGAQESTASSATDNNAASTPNTGGNEGTEVAASTDGEPLPNTGPESAVAGAIALGALAFAANSYLSSRRQLTDPTQR